MFVSDQIRQIFSVIFTLISVFITTRLGGALAIGEEGVSLLWPPNAILLGALILFDMRCRIVCLALSFPMFVIAELWSGYALYSALLFSIANCLEVLIALVLILRILDPPYTNLNFHNLLVMLFSVAVAAIVGGSIGAYALSQIGAPYFAALVGWVLSDFVAFLVFIPLILSFQDWIGWFRGVSPADAGVAALTIGSLVLILAIAQGVLGLDAFWFPGIQFAAVGLVFITSFRLGVKGSSVSSLLFFLIILAHLVHEIGPFSGQGSAISLVGMQAFVAAIVFSSTSLAILLSERNAAIDELTLINETLEGEVAQRSAELIKSNEQLAQAAKLEAIGKLTGSVAHDFNNQLAIIRGSIDLLELTDYSDESSAEIDSIKSAVNNGSSMTHRLLAYSRKTLLSPKPTDITALVQNRLNILRRLVGETVVVRCLADPDTWFADVDAHRLEDALLNLAVNARDAMPNGGDLNIRVENLTLETAAAGTSGDLEAGDYVVVTVADTGAGIPSDHLSKVIDPFFTTKEFGEGSGLGLSMAYGFAKQSGGHLEIESVENASTTVRLYLPRTRVKPVQNNEERRRLHATIRKTGRILVVEDDPEILRICENTLSIEGFDVTTASNGREAVSLLSKGAPFDLLFSDIVLPGGMSESDSKFGGGFSCDIAGRSSYGSDGCPCL